ncbi:MAG TPA: DUF2784 domain-containing protein [Micromonosporaceae bacterium]
MGWLVTVVLAVHFAYLAYLVVGGFVAWRWPAAIWPHLAACAWGVLIVFGLVDCPLTWAEDWARQQAGMAPLTTGFVDRYLDNVIYPDRYVHVVRLAVAVIVAVSWVGAYLRWRRKRGSIAASLLAPSLRARTGRRAESDTPGRPRPEEPHRHDGK